MDEEKADKKTKQDMKKTDKYNDDPTLEYMNVKLGAGSKKKKIK